MRVKERLLRIWRAVRGPKLRTYDAAREELGGVPWRPFASTERWFLVTPPPIPQLESRPITLDSQAIRLIRPSLLAGRGGYVAGAAGLLGIVLFVAALVGSGPPPRVAITPTAAKSPTPATAANFPTPATAANFPTPATAAKSPTTATAANLPTAATSAATKSPAQPAAQKSPKKRVRRR